MAESETTNRIPPALTTFQSLLSGLEAEHHRELEELRESLEAKIHHLHAQLQSQKVNQESFNSEVDTTQGQQVEAKVQPPGLPIAPAAQERPHRTGTTHFEHGELLQTYVKNVTEHNKTTSNRHKRISILEAQFNKFEADMGSHVKATHVGRIVQSGHFDAFCALMIVLNSILLGITVNLDFPSEEEDQTSSVHVSNLRTFCRVSNVFFSFWFAMELLLRALSEGICGFCCLSSNMRWNIFDTIVVSVDVVDLVFAAADKGQRQMSSANLKILRMLRILRVCRAVRVIRLVRFFTELRLMVLSIVKSGMSLLWTMLLLAMIIYVFGVLLMSLVSSHLEQNSWVSNRAALTKWFGSVAKVGYTLFLCISGGISWYEVSELLISIHWSYCLIISFYMFFTVFSMLNIITGIFVESAMSSVQNDKEEVIREQLTNEKGVLKKLEAIFHQADSKNVGTITIQDFEALMQVPETHALMSTMGLDVTEARGMFNLMDTERSGHVDIQEFLIGCVRMKGGAKAVDLVTLMFENKKLMDMLTDLVEFSEDEAKRARGCEATILHEVMTLKGGYKHLNSNQSMQNGDGQHIRDRGNITPGQDTLSTI